MVLIFTLEPSASMPALKLTPLYLSQASLAESPEASAEADGVREGDALLVLIYRQMRLLSGNHPELDDLVQSAVEQVLRSRFEGRSKFSTFTYGVCYRVWLKHLRSFYRWFRHFDETAAPADDSWQLSSELGRAELRQRVHQALAGIPPKQRAVILLHDIEELDVEEVAAIAQTKVGTVRSRLRDGRKALAQKLARDPYFGDEAIRKVP